MTGTAVLTQQVHELRLALRADAGVGRNVGNQQQSAYQDGAECMRHYQNPSHLFDPLFVRCRCGPLMELTYETPSPPRKRGEGWARGNTALI